MNGSWITDCRPAAEKTQSPKPMLFRKDFEIKGQVKRAQLQITALGIYTVLLNGNRVETDYFAPGFTSYRNILQVQSYDVTQGISEKNELLVTVGPGWAAGRYGPFGEKTYVERQSLLAVLRLEYEDGSDELICTGTDWQVTEDGFYRFADWYDGEIYDSTAAVEKMRWRPADEAKLSVDPLLVPQYGPAVKAHEIFEPVSSFRADSGEMIYDFGQNFAGVVLAEIDAEEGQEITFRHAEVLYGGELCTKPLRSAKAMAVYIAGKGHQTYSPRMTYMGFRYVGVRGIGPENIKLKAVALYSDIETIGDFSCSSADINRLQSNLVWSGKSNFLEIPTDCPQRDERMGWTADFALFAPTAFFNFRMKDFVRKWMRDLAYDQFRDGSIPMVIPFAGIRLPSVESATGILMERRPYAVWSDACILVPWAAYRVCGDRQLLEENYAVMKRHMKAVKAAAARGSRTKKDRLIWNVGFQYGDWAAPDGDMSTWVGRGPWVATAYYAHSCDLMSEIAAELGRTRDAEKFRRLFRKIAVAYRREFTDGAGRLKKEFQTGYVLPLYFGMVKGAEKRAMAGNLVRLLKENGWRLAAGFPAAPYLPFVLADNGYEEDAYRLLMQDQCPSWLYEVKAGATTTWEIWDAMKPDGTVNVGNLTEQDDKGMVSFNHYAYGSVGEFLYRRVAGIEICRAGYEEVLIRPVPGGGLTEAGAETQTPYGKLSVRWKAENGEFCLTVQAPEACRTVVQLPDGSRFTKTEETEEFSCRL